MSEEELPEGLPDSRYVTRKERDAIELLSRAEIEERLQKFQPLIKLTSAQRAMRGALNEALERKVKASRKVVPTEAPPPDGVDLTAESAMAAGAFDVPIDALPPEMGVMEALAREERAAEAEFARHEGRVRGHVSTGFPELPSFPREDEEDAMAEHAMHERLTARIARLERKLAVYRALVHELTGED